MLQVERSASRSPSRSLNSVQYPDPGLKRQVKRGASLSLNAPFLLPLDESARWSLRNNLPASGSAIGSCSITLKSLKSRLVSCKERTDPGLKLQVERDACDGAFLFSALPPLSLPPLSTLSRPRPSQSLFFFS